MSLPYRLQNVCMEQMPQFVQQPGLLCHSNQPVIFGDDGNLLLTAADTFDFTTFFGALSSCKWREYTVAETFHLHLELKGASATVVQTFADSFSYTPQRVERNTFEIPAGDEWHTVDFELAVNPVAGVDGFIVETQGTVRMRNAYYYTKIEESQVRPVELALATTTFKKESFIEHNIELVSSRILGSKESIGQHFHMHVVDNGRTLDIARLERPGISIYPNENVGGAGGFARGMIAAMEQEPKATHVLLMDDDVTISPESIIRTYNLLGIVNDDYREAFVSGAMMNMEEPDIRWEDTGFMTFAGACRQIKPVLRVSQLENVVQNELFKPLSDVPAFSDTKQAYAAWWYCCIPMSIVERNGLPLPIFVRFDDVEYGMRCHPKFMTMNGICIWHAAFHMRYNAGVERYQTTRNAFIAQLTTGMAPHTDFLKEFHHNVHLELKKYNYDDAELALEGFEDFLKGPEYIMQRGVAEQRFMDANRNKEKMHTFAELHEEALTYGIDLDKLTIEAVTSDIPRKKTDAMVDFITFNGQRISAGYNVKGKVAIIDAVGWSYPAGKMRQAETIIAVDIYAKKAAIRHKDVKRFNEIWGRYKKDVKYFKAHKDELKRAYSSARSEMTSVSFWKKYLGME